MKNYEVAAALEVVAEARAEWAAAQTKFQSDLDAVMSRLLLEAAVARMSVESVAKASGLTVKRVRSLLRSAGVDPHGGRSLIAAQASEALLRNAALLGVEPSEIDLLSPLAYLPMGEKMREILETSPEAAE